MSVWGVFLGNDFVPIATFAWRDDAYMWSDSHYITHHRTVREIKIQWQNGESILEEHFNAIAALPY